jgi:hypothetical protein
MFLQVLFVDADQFFLSEDIVQLFSRDKMFRLPPLTCLSNAKYGWDFIKDEVI